MILILLLLEFVFFLLCLPLAFVLGLIEVLIKIPFAWITGNRKIESFFVSSYSKFADEIMRKTTEIGGKK